MTQGKDWDFEYVGAAKKKIVVTPQVKALRERARKGMGPATSALTAQRVGVIADLMRQDKWNKEEKLKLKELWNLSISRVEQISAEASRWTAAEVTDPAAVTLTVAETLSRKLKQADELSTIAYNKAKTLGADKKVTVSVMKDASMMFQAIERTANTWSRVVGAIVPEKQDNAMLVAQFDQLPFDKKIEWLDGRIEMLNRAKQALLNTKSIIVKIDETKPAGTIEKILEEENNTNGHSDQNGVFYAGNRDEEGTGSDSE